MNLMFSWENKRRKYNKRLPFTEEEDQKLLKIISNTMNKGYDSNEQIREDLIDWKIISKEMGNRSVRQCKERYFHYLSPQINKKDWTPEEDSLLFSTVGNIGKKWKIMEDLFENRTEIDIRNRYYVLQRKITKAARLEKRYENYNLEIKEDKDSGVTSYKIIDDDEYSYLEKDINIVGLQRLYFNLYYSLINVENYEINESNIFILDYLGNQSRKYLIH